MAPQLLSMAMLMREDGRALFVQHAGGPFGGHWSPPLIGVGDTETAEDALHRLAREALHLSIGRPSFLETLEIDRGAERFIANAFLYDGWRGTPRFPASIFQDAIWVSPDRALELDLMPEVHEWLTVATDALATLTFPGAGETDTRP